MRTLRVFLLCLATLLPSLAIAANYDVEIRGLDDHKIIELIKDNCLIYTMKNSPPSTAASFKTRINKDIATIKNILHSESYYDAEISYHLESQNNISNLVLSINLGTPYHIENFSISSEESIDEKNIEKPILKKGEKATAEKIIGIEHNLIKASQNNGYPFAKIITRDVLVDNISKTVDINITFDNGPKAYFGEVHIEGLQKVSDNTVRRYITWEKEDPYSLSKVLETRKNIEDLGLFSLVTIFPSNNVENKGLLQITISVIEKQHRTIILSADYDTQMDFGGSLQWANRNFRSKGEKLALNLDVNKYKQQGSISYRLPYFKIPEQDFLWMLTSIREDSDSYKAYSNSLNATIERRFNKSTQGSIGGVLRQIHTAKTDDKQSYTLIGMPLSLNIRKTDQTYDPRNGHSIKIYATPYIDLENTYLNFTSTKLTASYYFSLLKKDLLTIAFSTTMGATYGASRANIPAPYRFYGGSSSMLRGYKYHTVSPLDGDNKPIGGRSITLFNIETRLHATSKLGLDIFYDAGNIFESCLPRFNKKLLQATGIALQYNTPVGPFRTDFAVPLNRRAKLDNKFQVYVSLGHNF